MSENERQGIFGGVNFNTLPGPAPAVPQREHRYGPRAVPMMGSEPETQLEAAASYALAGEASDLELARLERTRNYRTRSDYFQVQLLLSRFPRLAETLRHIDQDLIPELFRSHRLETMSTKDLEFLLALMIKRQDLDQKFILEMGRRGPRDLPALIEREVRPSSANLSRAAEAMMGLAPAERERVTKHLSSLVRVVSRASNKSGSPGQQENDQ